MAWSANRVRDFVRKFVRINGSKSDLLNWQWERLIKPFYGDGKSPRHKRISLWCPKKSGKSLITALLVIVHALENPRANVLLCASTVEQGGTLFRFMSDIITSEPMLDKRFWIREQRNEIVDLKNKSRIKLLSGSPKSKAGPNTTMIVIEEAADYTPANLRAVYDQLVYSSMANYGKATTVMVVLSTAGFIREGHMAYDLYREAADVQKDPLRDPQHLAVVYAVPDDADWKDPANWWQHLPSCPEIVPRQFYLDEFAALKQDTLGEARFRTLLLNQYLGLGHGENWISSFAWSNCKTQITEQELHGCKAWGGLDMSRRYDLTAWVLLVEKESKLYLLPRFLTCADGLQQKEKLDGFPYSLHAREPKNNLTVIAGAVIDPAKVREKILEDCRNFKVKSIGYDPAYLSDETRQILDVQHGISMVEVPQRYSVLSQPTMQFERWVRTQRLQHGGNPIMAYCVEGAVLKTDGSQCMVDKRKTRTRIDGVQAAVIAIQRYLDTKNMSSPFTT